MDILVGALAMRRAGNLLHSIAGVNWILGLSVAALGPFFEVDTPVNGDDINGWPLFSKRQTFATISGFFDQQVSFIQPQFRRFALTL